MEQILPIGELLNGRYHITQYIASGGFSQVYLAEDKKLGKRKVVIRLLVELTVDSQSNFIEEANRLANLQHENIITIHEIEHYQQWLFMVLAYAPGGSLQDEIDKSNTLYSLADMLKLIRPIANALQEAHNENLLHLDIKPGNILLGKNRKPILADFGLSTTMVSTQTSMLVPKIGTPGFSAPEQYQEKANQKSDQYSLAAVIYYMITGHTPPYKASKTSTTGLRYLPFVEDIIFTALAEDYNHRYASINKFMEALEEAVEMQDLQPGQQNISKVSPSSITQPLDMGYITHELLDAIITSKENPYADEWGKEPFFIITMQGYYTTVTKKKPEPARDIYSVHTSSINTMVTDLIDLATEAANDLTFQSMIQIDGYGSAAIMFRAKNEYNGYALRIDTYKNTWKPPMRKVSFVELCNGKEVGEPILILEDVHDNVPFVIGVVTQRYQFDIYIDGEHRETIHSHTWKAGTIKLVTSARKKKQEYAFHMRNIRLWFKKNIQINGA